MYYVQVFLVNLLVLLEIKKVLMIKRKEITKKGRSKASLFINLIACYIHLTPPLP